MERDPARGTYCIIVNTPSRLRFEISAHEIEMRVTFDERCRYISDRIQDELEKERLARALDRIPDRRHEMRNFG
jgi:hypothetical protein